MSSLSEGIGLVLTPYLPLVITLAVALGSCTLGLLAAAACTRNEVVLARRANVAIKIAATALLAIAIAETYFEFTVPLRRRAAFPDYGAYRPLAGIVLSYLALFAAMHPLYRWLAVGAHTTLLVGHVMCAAARDAQVDCWTAGKCVTAAGRQLSDIETLRRLSYAGAFASVWVVLLAGYFLIALGACHSRYPVRLLSMVRAFAGVGGGVSGASAGAGGGARKPHST